MEIKAHFADIHKAIVDQLYVAQSEIVAAIAWFTDREILDVLCKRSALGVTVSVAIVRDEINCGAFGLNFQKLVDLGGTINYIQPGSRDEPLMHHKFCVIDGKTIITGSYNWSLKARSNNENITVITEAPELAAQYLAAFHDLVGQGHIGRAPEIDIESARRRLELIRNLVLLGEHEGIGEHTRKLRPASKEFEIGSIIEALNNGDFTAALELIEDHLSRAKALVQSTDIEIPRLKLQLKALEIRLESLSDEKAELERRLVVFNRKHDTALGDLIERVLEARAKLAKLLAVLSVEEETVEAEEKAREAYERYYDYAKQHETLKNAEPLPVLDEQSEQDLKRLYKKAASLCHPDKVTEQQKDEAHSAFVALRDAYSNNDLARVRDIYEQLKSGGMLSTRSSVLSEIDSLKAAIAQMEHNIIRVVQEINVMSESDSVRLMESVGGTEAAWESYVITRHHELETELEQIEQQILEHSVMADFNE